MRPRRTFTGPVLRFGPALRDAPGEPDNGPTDLPSDDEGVEDVEDVEGNVKFKGEYDQARAERAVSAARKGEQRSKKEIAKLKESLDKANKESADFREKLAIALGLKLDPSQDPTKVAEEATAALAVKDARIAQLMRDNTLTMAAHKHGGILDELRDSTSFMKKLDELDMDDDDYATEVDKIVKQTIRDNPRFASTDSKSTSKRRMGTDHTGDNPGRKRKGLSGAINDAIGT
jgi:hypothetical protein